MGGGVGGRRLRRSRAGRRAELLRLAGSDGSVRWRTEAPVGDVSTMHVADGVLLVSLVQSDATTASLEAFDADTGAPAWRYERPAVDILGSLADDGHTVALVQTPDDTAEVVVLNRAGAEVWNRRSTTSPPRGTTSSSRSGGDVTMVDLASGEDRRGACRRARVSRSGWLEGAPSSPTVGR